MSFLNDIAGSLDTLLRTILLQLPEGSLPAPILFVIGLVHMGYGIFDWFFPAATVLQILQYVFLVEFAIFSWGSINWLINKIRGSG